jgi:hypothetical protein
MPTKKNGELLGRMGSII